jgi:hypothetical protein
MTPRPSSERRKSRRAHKTRWLRHPVLWIAVAAAAASIASYHVSESLRVKKARQACEDAYRRELGQIGPRLRTLLTDTVNQDIRFLSLLNAKQRVHANEAAQAQRSRAEFHDQLNALVEQVRALDRDLHEELHKTVIARSAEVHARVTTMVRTASRGDALSVADQQLKEGLLSKMAEWEVGKAVDRAFERALTAAKVGKAPACKNAG